MIEGNSFLNAENRGFTFYNIDIFRLGTMLLFFLALVRIGEDILPLIVERFGKTLLRDMANLLRSTLIFNETEQAGKLILQRRKLSSLRLGYHAHHTQPGNEC